MVKAYLRYEAQATFGIIASSTANIAYDHSGKIAIAPALEEVILWDLKKGVEVISMLHLFRPRKKKKRLMETVFS